MRTPRNTVIATLALALAGCSSGVTVVRQPPAPRPLPVVIEALEVDIARPHNGKLFVQTNRPAYVAIFEIIPERGVTLVYPVSTRQRRFVVSGLREVPVWWESSRVTSHGAGMVPSRSEPARYIYALASDTPLRLPDDAFANDYLYAALGPRAYRATNPYATMRALAREFLPPVAEEAWAEDEYAVSRRYATERYRVTRVYCRDGSMYEVPSEFADRVWCGTRGRSVPNGAGRPYDVDLTSSDRPQRPDSIVGDNGRRLAVRTRGANGRGVIDRVQEPPGLETKANGGEERVKDDPPGHAKRDDNPEPVSNGRPERPDDRAQGSPPSRDATARIRAPAPRRPAPTPERVQPPESADSGDKAEKVERRREPEPQPKAELKADEPAESKPVPAGQTNAESKAESKAEEKSQSPSDKRGEPEKGRGRPNASDDKPAGKKPKQAPEPKP